MISQILINGEVSDGRIPVTDSAVLRGDGCFEVLKAREGLVFALDGHLDRLERSAGRLEIELPPKEHIGAWIKQIAESVGDGAVRVVVTRGSAVPGLDDPSRLIVFGHTWDMDPRPAELLPVAAPWHSAGVEWELAGAKILSYAPNLSATRRAKSEGFDDALLLTTDGVVLEGPTFSIAWVIDDVLETPTLDIGILDSITRRVVLDLARDLAIGVVEGTWPLDRLELASEVMALSTVREVQPVARVGDRSFAEGPVTRRLADALDNLFP